MSRAAPIVVMWDVGGTLVDYAPTATELLARTVAQVGLRLDQFRPESVMAADEAYRDSNLRWRTLTEERHGWRRVAAIMTSGAAAATDHMLTERLGMALSE